MGEPANNLGASDLRQYDYAIGDEMRGERATLGKSLLDVQRDLRIKAAYVAAIENADPAVFPNPSFIPGYVRSYARYLGMDPELVYARFRAESGFSVHGTALKGSASPARGKRGAAPARGVFTPNFPMAEAAHAGISAIPVSAIGSLLVLGSLVAGLAYGGWTVLQNIQRVEFAPVEEAPMALASVDPLAAPAASNPAAGVSADLASPVAATALADLYRRQELEVPILVPRDGPIAAIDPERVGLLAGRDTAATLVRAAPPAAGPAASSTAAPAAAVPEANLSAAPDPAAAAAEAVPAPAALTVVAERAAWIRVYAADGTVLFERILETGEAYSPPADIAPPMIWAGNSGSVYVRLGAVLHGPLGSGTRSVRDVVLDPASIAATYGIVATIPEPIARAFDASIEQAAVALP